MSPEQKSQLPELFRPVTQETFSSIVNAHKKNLSWKKQLYFSKRYRIVTLNFKLFAKDRALFTISPFKGISAIVIGMLDKGDAANKKVANKNSVAGVSWRGMVIDPVFFDRIASSSRSERFSFYKTISEIFFGVVRVPVPRRVGTDPALAALQKTLPAANQPFELFFGERQTENERGNTNLTESGKGKKSFYRFHPPKESAEQFAIPLHPERSVEQDELSDTRPNTKDPVTHQWNNSMRLSVIGWINYRLDTYSITPIKDVPGYYLVREIDKNKVLPIDCGERCSPVDRKRSGRYQEFIKEMKLDGVESVEPPDY